MTDTPELSGFEMAAQIESTVDRLVILWFSKIDRDRSLWIQAQVTLVDARRILLSDFSAGQIIGDVEHHDTTGKTTYRLKLSSQSSR